MGKNKILDHASGIFLEPLVGRATKSAISRMLTPLLLIQQAVSMSQKQAPEEEFNDLIARIDWRAEIQVVIKFRPNAS